MKVAVIGLGVIGSLHVNILKNFGNEIVGVCDTDEEKLANYSGINQYTDYIKMLDEQKPEVVHICTPHYLHAEMVIEGLKRNINVLCEKPLCIKKEDIDKILEAEEKSSAMLGVCFQNRYNPVSRFVKNYLEGKKIESGVGTVFWERGAEYYASGPWRGKWDTEGGGVLINQAIHTLDLIEWLIGEPEYVTASISNLTLSDFIEVEDTVSALFTGEHNFSFFATNGSKNSFPIEITIKTENDIIRMFENHVVINGEIKTFEKSEKVNVKECYGTGHEALIDDFYSCIKTGKKFAIDGKEAQKAVRLVLGVYASGRKRIKI